MFYPRALVLGCAVLCQPSLARESALTKYEQEFRTWMKDFGVAFHDVESFFERFHIFASNAHFIDSHNENADIHGYTLKHNAFSNLTWPEFRESYFGLNVPEEYVAKRQARGHERVEASFLTKYENQLEDVPDSMDWVEKGAVSPVKNQGQCGSCWAFSTTGAIEGAAFVSGQKLENLSEQELVDCDHADMGCNGGLMDHAFYWVEKHGGMCSEQDYAYQAAAGTCQHSTCENVVEVETFHDVPGNDEEALKLAVAQQPVSVAIEADQRAFQFYSSGVFTAACGAKLDHGVLAVGYGTLDGTKYWKVKNSWGPKWGLEGYILLERDVDAAEGQCGIASVPSYPSATIVSKKKEEKSTTPAFRMGSTRRQKKSAAVFDLDRVVIPTGPSQGAISQCGSAKVVDFSSFSMAPTTPVRGQPIEIVAQGLVLKAFDAVNFKLSVTLGGAEVFSSNGNMCGSTHVALPLGLGHIDVTGFHCPVAQGPVPQVGLKVVLPVIAPAGDYEITISGTSPGQDTEIFCIGVKLDLAYEDETSYFPNQVYQIMTSA